MGTTNILDLNNRVSDLEKAVSGGDSAQANMRMSKLWENPNPNSTFLAQNVALNNDDYDCLIILYNWTTSTPSSFSTLVQKNHNFELSATLPSTSGMRTASRPGSNNSTTEVHFGDCLTSVASSGTIDNDRCIPTIIYGIKLT